MTIYGTTPISARKAAQYNASMKHDSAKKPVRYVRIEGTNKLKAVAVVA